MAISCLWAFDMRLEAILVSTGLHVYVLFICRTLDVQCTVWNQVKMNIWLHLNITYAYNWYIICSSTVNVPKVQERAIQTLSRTETLLAGVTGGTNV